MLQRVQTLYLLIVAVLAALLFFFPFCNLTVSETGTSFILSHSVYFSFLLVVASLLLSLVSIFLYKKRTWQIKLNYMNIAVFIVMYVVALLDSWGKKSIITRNTDFDFALLAPVAMIPLLNIIFTLLAIFRIRKDEKLVRSLDRLR